MLHSLLSPSHRDLGTLSNSETLAVRLSPAHTSTALSKWVRPEQQQQSEYTFEPVAVFPELDGVDSIIFPDTVVVRVATRTMSYQVHDVVTTKPVDASALSPFVQSIFGVIGDYAGITAIEDREGWGWQEYYISTCNLQASKGWAICRDIQAGKHIFQGEPLRFVRIDLTSNVPGAIAPLLS